MNHVTEQSVHEGAAERLGLIRRGKNQSSAKSLNKTDLLELEI